MSALPPSQERLDSWKAIADYLQRDLATVRRWEKGLGMPVHRVAGSGRSVFAYRAEIDAWLTASKDRVPPAGTEAETLPVVPPAAAASRAPLWSGVALAVVVLSLIAGLARPRPPAPGDLRAVVTPAGVVATDAWGAEQWRYPFPADYQTVVPSDAVQVVTGKDPGVLFITSHRGRHTEDQVESGELTLLDTRGRVRQSFSFADEVRFAGKPFGAPWAVTSFAVDETTGARRVAVAAHHYVWDPGVVTVLDAQWRRRGTFVHAGWIEAVRWLASDRLLIGGYSNAYEGGMVAVLDPDHLDGQGPVPAGSRHHCENCGSNAPLRMFVFPRTELNQVTASRFNRVRVSTGPARVFVHTIEVPSAGGDADALYEFTPGLDLVSASFGERYWDLHRSLEAEGRIRHTRDQCPDRDGPPSVQVWEPASGWQTVQF